MGGNLYEKPTIWTKNEKNITFSIDKKQRKKDDHVIGYAAFTKIE